jgi:hypothetical protein
VANFLGLERALATRALRPLSEFVLLLAWLSVEELKGKASEAIVLTHRWPLDSHRMKRRTISFLTKIPTTMGHTMMIHAWQSGLFLQLFARSPADLRRR